MKMFLKEAQYIYQITIISEYSKQTKCIFTPFAQQMGLSVHGPDISPGWRRCQRICGPSGSASDHPGLSYLEKTTYMQTHACSDSKVLRKMEKCGFPVERNKRYRSYKNGKKYHSVLVVALTWAFRFNQIKHLAEQILEGQRFDAHPFHPLTLFFIEVLQLKHGQDTITIYVHTPEPVLNAGETNYKSTQFQKTYRHKYHAVWVLFITIF